jgi:hypothetical protein
VMDVASALPTLPAPMMATFMVERPSCDFALLEFVFGHLCWPVPIS